MDSICSFLAYILLYFLKGIGYSANSEKHQHKNEYTSVILNLSNVFLMLLKNMKELFVISSKNMFLAKYFEILSRNKSKTKNLFPQNVVKLAFIIIFWIFNIP